VAPPTVPIHMEVNGTAYSLGVSPSAVLLDVLRETLGLKGTKRGCGQGQCGTCTILLDGRPVNSCILLAVQADGRKIVTIEGLAIPGNLHPIQEAFVHEGAVQCGFCTPGMILSAKALLDANPSPSEEEIRTALSGNLCRCSGYVKIIRAVQRAAEAMERARHLGAE